MSTETKPSRRETKDERAHRIATGIIQKERAHRESKTARLRAKRLAVENAA